MFLMEGWCCRASPTFRSHMKSILGVYKIPVIKLAFFVIPDSEDRKPKLPSNRKTREYFERILRLKDRGEPSKDRSWRIKRVHLGDFLQSIEQCMTIAREYTSQSSHNRMCMELLAMNPGRSFVDDPTYFTPKTLDIVGIDDIIQVFI